jgi:L-iditol 2-dehydrogenase
MIENNSLHFLKPKKIYLRKSIIDLQKNEILINVKSCGMCGTDLKIFKKGSHRVKKNRIIGHEISGQIIKVPNNQSYFKKNSNIILGADIENLENKNFALGHEVDGGFQKYMKIDANLLKKVPHYLTNKKINYDQASMTEPLACCINGLEKIGYKPNSVVVIFGAGTIGQLIAKLCIHSKSQKVYLIDSNNFKLKNGIKDKKIIKLKYSNFKKILTKNILDKIKYTFVACSSAQAQKEAVKLAPEDSSVNFFAGLPKKKGQDILTPINTNAIHYKQLKIVGSHGSKLRHIQKAAKLITENKLKIKNLITNTYKISDYRLAFIKLMGGKSLKIIIKP